MATSQMVPGSDPARAPECMSCRVMGATILSGTGLYTIWASFNPADSASVPVPPHSKTQAGSTSVGNWAEGGKVLSGRAMTPGLGLDTKGFQRGIFSNPMLGRTFMAGFGSMLVLAGIARGMGVTHYDVLRAKDHFFGSKNDESTPAYPAQSA